MIGGLQLFYFFTKKAANHRVVPDGNAGDGDNVVAQVVLLVRVEASRGPEFVFEQMIFGGEATACGARSLFGRVHLKTHTCKRPAKFSRGSS